MPDILAAADVIVCRAGAGTVWEAASLSKPMILVPLLAGSRGDQLENARQFEAAGGALVFTDEGRLASDVSRSLEELRANPERRQQLGQNAHNLIQIDAAGQIVTILRDVLDRGR
jgi:UDP-N-acetylglucosamine--N-acetylmuramyl-(pentapeptide) pyrophosphoryl-undecaprenol N-acetylglucosamine transferase